MNVAWRRGYGFVSCTILAFAIIPFRLSLCPLRGPPPSAEADSRRLAELSIIQWQPLVGWIALHLAFMDMVPLSANAPAWLEGFFPRRFLSMAR